MSNSMIENNPKLALTKAKSVFSSVMAFISALMVLATQSVVAQPSDAPSLTESSVFEWLQRMSETQKNANYHGIFTYEYGAELASVEVWHGVKDGHEIERMIHLDGEPREVIRDSESLRCKHEGKKLIQIDQHDDPSISTRAARLDLDKIKATYNARYIGRYRVAGHSAIVVELTPKDVYRYGQRYFIGSDNKMLLKNILFDGKRRALERFQFTYLNMNANLTDAHFKPQLEMVESVVSADSETASAQITPESELVTWRLDWVPDGFEQVLGQATRQAEQMYSDGLAGFSVFVDQESIPGSRSASSLLRGATLVYSRPLSVQGKSINVTVVGEIPLTAAERIAASIEFSP